MGEQDKVARFRKAYWTLVHNLDSFRLRIWEERGLTLPQLRVLFLIRRHPGITTNEVASSLGITMSTVSGLVDKLVRAGLVERGRHPEDRRVVPLRLTPEGEAVTGEIRQGDRVYLARLAELLGDDLGEVTDTLERLVRLVEQLPASQEISSREVGDGSG